MDPMTIWFWLWLVAAAALFISEMLSATLFLLPFAVGAIAAWIFNMLGLGIVWQWLVFLVVSIISLVALRPLARRLSSGPTVKSGVDRLIGLDAVIIDQPAPLGLRRAKVDGEVWNVGLEPGFEYMIGDLRIDERVYVMRVEGTRLIVRRYQ